jgi:hypothetical protein
MRHWEREHSWEREMRARRFCGACAAVLVALTWAVWQVAQ